jgi:predicted phosphate transport protein (TIGR00153 family)
MGIRLFPKKVDFFSIFEKSAKILVDASTELLELFEHFDDLEARIAKIRDWEHDNDDLTHETMSRLNQTFLTPIDREDIHALTTSLDDVLDFLWAAGDRVVLFHVGSSRPCAIELARSLRENCLVVQRAIGQLRRKNYAALQEACIEINRLENEADSIFREAMGKLFEVEADPIQLIKWKEILEFIEMATDKCEDVANTLEAVVLKHA